MSGNILRWSGLVAAASGLLFGGAIAARYLLFEMETIREGIRFPFIALQVLTLVAGICILIGLVGLYTRQAQAAGRFGFIAFLVTFVGWTMSLGVFWFLAFGLPTFARMQPTGDFLDENPYLMAQILSFSLAGLGWLLFGIASLRARIFPRWAVGLLIVGDLIWGFWSGTNPLAFPIGEVALAAGLVAMGYVLWAEASPQPVTVSA